MSTAEATTSNQTAQSGDSTGPLTAEEQAQFDAMRAADGAAPPPAPEPDAPAAPGEAPAQTTPPAAPQAGQQPPAAAAAEDDDDAEEQPAQPGQQQQPKRVSFHKYKRETDSLRQQLSDINKQLQDRTISQAKLEERLGLINEALSTPAQQRKQEEQDPRPDPEQDIFGYAAWLERQMVNAKTQFEQRLSEFQGNFQAQNEDQQLQQAFESDAQAFAAREPNFPPAYQYLMQSRAIELAQYWFGKDITDQNEQLTADQIDRIRKSIALEERDMVREAVEQGLSPSQRVMALARARGFRPMTPEQIAATRAGQNGQQPAAQTNGAAQPAPQAAPGALAQPQQQKPSVADEIARIKAGTEASRSLSDGGAAPAPTLTPERLVNMNQDEFGELLENLRPDQLRQILGA